MIPPLKPKRVVGAALKAKMDQMRQVRTVLAKADDAEIKRRLELCRACPHLVRGKLNLTDRCGKCGCPIIGKTRFQRAKCPDNPPRW